MAEIFVAGAQVPNSEFSNWVSMGDYDIPEYWGTMNNATAWSGVYTCKKASDGAPGQYHLRLTSKEIGGLDVIAGVAVCGILDTLSMTAKSGFPISNRPVSIDLKCQHMIFGNSQGFIDALLTRWNNVLLKRDTVAIAYYTLIDMAMGWEYYSIPFVYNSALDPDSAIIFVSASGNNPVDGDYIWIDSVRLEGNYTSAPYTTEIFLPGIYYDPDRKAIFISVDSADELIIYNALGQLRLSVNCKNGLTTRIDLNKLETGIYIAEVRNGSNVFRKKILN